MNFLALIDVGHLQPYVPGVHVMGDKELTLVSGKPFDITIMIMRSCFHLFDCKLKREQKYL